MGIMRVKRSGNRAQEDKYRIRCTGERSKGLMYDVISATNWTLMTGGGFLTTNHFDAAGWCTWSIITCGEKVWAYQEPKSNPRDEESASRAYIEIAKASDQWTQKTEDELPKIAFSRSICLKPGTLL